MPDSIIKADNIAGLTTSGVGIPDGTVAAPGLKFTNDGDSGLYRIGADTIGIATNGARVGEIGTNYGGFTGNIIQVQSTTITNAITISSTTLAVFYDVTGLSVNITPRYSNSKILIFGNVTLSVAGGGYVYNTIRILRDTTPIGIGDSASNRTRSTSGIQVNVTGNSVATIPFNILDSPNTTSIINYKIQVLQNAASTANIFINRDSTDTDASNYSRYVSSITVMELQQ